MGLKRYKDFIIESKEDREKIWTYKEGFKVKEYMVLDGKFIKDKIPDIIIGSFECLDLELISLEGGPKEVGGSFDCSNNKLTSLEGGPKKVGKFYYCSHNELISLEGVPEKVRGSFSCHSNKLTSLEGGPKEVGGNYDCYNNYNLTSLEGISKVGFVNSDFKIEQDFINSRSYINNYWMDLLKYMIKEKIDLTEVKGWPKDFLNDEIIKSVKSLKKFNI